MFINKYGIQEKNNIHFNIFRLKASSVKLNLFTRYIPCIV